MQYQVEENCLTIFLPKEVDHHNAEEIRKEADQVIAKKHIKHVIFDFSSTNFMDSSGIGVIMGRYKKVLFLGGHVAVTNVGKNINRVLKFSGLYNIVSLHQSNTEALECFSGKKK